MQSNFCARAINLSKKITLPMTPNFSQQILTLLEDTYFPATRLKLPEQLITTRAIRTLHSKDGHCSTNSKRPALPLIFAILCIYPLLLPSDW